MDQSKMTPGMPVRVTIDEFENRDLHGLIGTVILPRQFGDYTLIDFGPGFNGHSGDGGYGTGTYWRVPSKYVEQAYIQDGDPDEVL